MWGFAPQLSLEGSSRIGVGRREPQSNLSGRFAPEPAVAAKEMAWREMRREQTKLDVVQGRVTSLMEWEDVGSNPTWSTC